MVYWPTFTRPQAYPNVGKYTIHLPHLPHLRTISSLKTWLGFHPLLWVFPKMVGFPNLHPQVLIIFSSPWLLGKPTILGNIHMGGSKNRGIPKWMVKIMENPKMDDLGGKPHHFRKPPIYSTVTRVNFSLPSTGLCFFFFGFHPPSTPRDASPWSQWSSSTDTAPKQQQQQQQPMEWNLVRLIGEMGVAYNHHPSGNI